jgi:hypothetical protein
VWGTGNGRGGLFVFFGAVQRGRGQLILKKIIFVSVVFKRKC